MSSSAAPDKTLRLGWKRKLSRDQMMVVSTGIRVNINTPIEMVLERRLMV